jgi:hypothetical protein
MAMPSEPGQLTPFGTELASMTERAHESLAEVLVRHLQERCMTDAASGRHVAEWEARLPGERDFVIQVAREFAGRLVQLDFSSVEWWHGRAWIARPGKFSVLVNDDTAQSHAIRVRVWWPERLPAGAVPTTPSKEQPPALLSSLEVLLDLQTRMLKQAIDNQDSALLRRGKRETDEVCL